MADAVVFMNPVPSKAPQISAFKFLKVIGGSYDNVTILSSSLDDTPDARVINIKYKKQSNKILRLLNFVYFQLKAFFKSMSVLHSGDTAFFWVGDKMFSSHLACKLKGVKTCFFLYGMTSLENNDKKAENTARSQNFLAEHSDYICVESPSVLTDRGITCTDNTRIIHLYVEKPSVICDPKKRIGMLCRLAHGKCVLQSIEGFCDFHKTHKDYTLEIVGDGILMDECKSLVKELDAEDCITLFGWLSHEQLNAVSPYWKLLLFPTKTEGLPNSMLECMSIGVPPVASAVGGIKDVIIDNENGFILPNDDAKTISKKLSEVVDTAPISSVSINAQKTVDERFTLQKAQENFRRVKENSL